MHPEARLTAAERQELSRGLDRTFAAFAEGGENGTNAGELSAGEDDRDAGAGREDERGEH
jgi:hypothetical protein